jgi:hypothetical protein
MVAGGSAGPDGQRQREWQKGRGLARFECLKKHRGWASCLVQVAPGRRPRVQDESQAGRNCIYGAECMGESILMDLEMFARKMLAVAAAMQNGRKRPSLPFDDYPSSPASRCYAIPMRYSKAKKIANRVLMSLVSQSGRLVSEGISSSNFPPRVGLLSSCRSQSLKGFLPQKGGFRFIFGIRAPG